MARLFIDTLKGLPLNSSWSSLLALLRNRLTWKSSLVRFFEDDTEVFVPILLAVKQKIGELIKVFVKRFWGMVLRCPSGMTQSTLVETYCHNLQTMLMVQIGVIE